MSRELMFKLGPLEIYRGRGQQKAHNLDWFVQFMRMANEEDSAAGGIAVNEAYEKISWVNIAVNTRASNLARAPLRLYSGDTEVKTGPIWNLLQRPNQNLTLAQLVQATESWVGFLGESFWWLWTEAGRAGFPQRIYDLDPRKIEHVLARDRMEIEAYKYHDDEGRIIPIFPSQIIHFATWNSKSPWRGISPWAALGDEIYQTYHANRVISTLLANGAIPPGILSVPESITEEDAAALKERWKKNHGGSGKRAEVAVLGSGAEFKRISDTAEDFQQHDLLAWNREAIFARAGVPPAVAGISKDSSPLSGTDTADQLRQFWQTTLISEERFIETNVTTNLLARFGSKLTAEFDNSDIPELHEDEEKLHARAREDFKSGLLDREEARDLIGMEPPTPKQIFWMPFSVQPVQNDETPEPEPAPAPEQPPAAESPDESSPERESLLMNEKAKTFSSEYKANHWRLLTRGWDAIESKYRKKVRSLFYDIGKAILSKLAGKEVQWAGRAPELFEDPFWDKYGDEMAAISKRPLTDAMEMVGGMMGAMFEDMGLGVSFDIYDTRAVILLDKRLDKIKGVVAGTLRDQYLNVLRTGMASEMTFDQISEEIRRIRDISQNRADTIVRTEIGGAVNDSRVASFLHEDFHYHQWGTALDDNVRDTHQIDGEVRALGQPFSNGLMYPNDPSGSAEEVINCRCITYPLTDAEAEAGGV